MFQTNFIEKIKTRFMFNTLSISFKNRAAYEVSAEILYSQTDRQRNMAHAHCILDN